MESNKWSRWGENSLLSQFAVVLWAQDRLAENSLELLEQTRSEHKCDIVKVVNMTAGHHQGRKSESRTTRLRARLSSAEASSQACSGQPQQDFGELSRTVEDSHWAYLQSRTALPPRLRAISSRAAQRRREGTEGGPIYGAVVMTQVTTKNENRSPERLD